MRARAAVLRRPSFNAHMEPRELGATTHESLADSGMVDSSRIWMRTVAFVCHSLHKMDPASLQIHAVSSSPRLIVCSSLIPAYFADLHTWPQLFVSWSASLSLPSPGVIPAPCASLLATQISVEEESSRACDGVKLESVQETNERTTERVAGNKHPTDTKYADDRRGFARSSRLFITPTLRSSKATLT